jgi:hemerythrin-like domain-containing protein
MKAIDILVKEHGLISLMLNTLDKAKKQIERGQFPPKEFFKNAVEFSRSFADKYHHYKEEYLMFGLLAQKKEGDIDLETGVLRFQHERCRECINAIENSIEGYAEGNEIATTILLGNLSSYISILKWHIHIEDNIFFGMAKKEISEEEAEILYEQFLEEAKSYGGKDFVEKNRALIHELVAMLNEPEVATLA